MKTLIFNGSPRVAGDTASLIDLLVSKLHGEIKIVNAYRCDISPCMDCRFCWKSTGCAISDEMQEVYAYIEDCDNILIASPIYFSELTGKILDVGSRLQTYFCAGAFRQEKPIRKEKRGAVILVGGGDGGMEKAFGTARTLLHYMNCQDIHELVYCHNTNQTPAIRDEKATSGVLDIVSFFSESNDMS